IARRLAGSAVEAGERRAGRERGAGQLGVAADDCAPLRRKVGRRHVLDRSNDGDAGQRSHGDGGYREQQPPHHAYCTLMLAVFTTFAHFSISLRRKASNSSGVFTSGTAPCFSQAAFTSGLLITELMCLLR